MNNHELSFKLISYFVKNDKIKVKDVKEFVELVEETEKMVKEINPVNNSYIFSDCDAKPFTNFTNCDTKPFTNR
jgi:hypothetical protein